MDTLSVVRTRDQERAHDDSCFEDDRSSRRDPDSSTANLLVPLRPQSQHFHSHDNQASKSPQTHTPALWQFFWWLLTVVLSALILTTIKIYKTLGNFTSVQKHTFNIISTALILGLGLNYFVGHHAYALNDRGGDSSNFGYAGSIQIFSERIAIENIKAGLLQHSREKLHIEHRESD